MCGVQVCFYFDTAQLCTIQKSVNFLITVSDIDYFIHIQYPHIVQLLISDTDVNQYWYIRSWNQHILSNLYCDVLLES